MPYVLNLFNQAAPGIGAGLSATTTSRTLSGQDHGRTLLILDVFDDGSWVPGTGTIKVKARAMGASLRDAASTTFTVANLEYWDRTTTTDTAGSTAINAAGIYEYDITGLEAQIVYTRGTDTGVVGIRANIVAVNG